MQSEIASLGTWEIASLGLLWMDSLWIAYSNRQHSPALDTQDLVVELCMHEFLQISFLH